mgnify:CR=1 FL=1
MFCIVVISVNALLMYRVFDIFVCCLCSLTGYAGMPINQRSERRELDNLFFENVKSKPKQLMVRYMDQPGTGHDFADPKWT